MAAGLEGATEEGVQDGEGHVLPDESGTEAQDVGIVVSPRQARRDGLRDEGRADAGVSVGCDGHADAGATDEDAPLDARVSQHAGDFPGEDGIVAPVGTVTADVDDLVPGCTRACREDLLETVSGVIASEGEAHEDSES